MTGGDLAVVLEDRGHPVQVRSAGNGWRARCPAHDDGPRRRDWSLSISEGQDGRRLLHCFAGCSFEDVRDALGLPRDAFSGWQGYERSGSSCGLPRNAHYLVTLRASPRHGEAVRSVIADVAARATRARGRRFAYALPWASQRLGVHGAQVGRALDYLLRSGQIARAGVLPPEPGEAKTPTRLYRLKGGAR